MAGSRPSSYFSVFMVRDTVEIHKFAKKNEYQAILTEQAWSIENMGFRDIFSLNSASSSRARLCMLVLWWRSKLSFE